MELKYTFTKTISISDIYRDMTEEKFKYFEKEYEIKFLPPKENERFISYCSHTISIAHTNYPIHDPRLVITPRIKTVSGNVSHTQTFTVKEIYGKDEVKIPEGWRYVGFDVPDDRQYYLMDFNAAPTRGSLRTPRIIVERCS